MLVGVFEGVEGEGVLVLVGVADGQSAVAALDHQQLHLVLGGDRRLRLLGVEAVELGGLVGGVVTEAVGVRDRGGQRLAERIGLHHLEADAAHGQVGDQFADQAGQPGAGGQDHHVGAVDVAVVVADGCGAGPGGASEAASEVAPEAATEAGHRADLAAGEEGVAAGGAGAQGLPEVELCGARLDGRVPLAPQCGLERAAQGRVDLPRLGRGEQLVAAGGGVRAGQGRLGDREFAGGADGSEGAVGAEAQAGHLRADAFPELAGPQGGVELFSPGPSTDPDLAEITQGRAAGLRFSLDLDDLVAAFDCLPGVHGADHAASDDYDSHAANGGSGP